jgi:hypothetical protein
MQVRKAESRCLDPPAKKQKPRCVCKSKRIRSMSMSRPVVDCGYLRRLARYCDCEYVELKKRRAYAPSCRELGRFRRSRIWRAQFFQSEDIVCLNRKTCGVARRPIADLCTILNEAINGIKSLRACPSKICRRVGAVLCAKPASVHFAALPMGNDPSHSRLPTTCRNSRTLSW